MVSISLILSYDYFLREDKRCRFNFFKFSDWFEIDKDVVKELVGDYLSKQDRTDSFNWANNIEEIASEIASSKSIFLDAVDLSSEAIEKLERFEEEIMSYVNQLESVSFWKEIIDSNPEAFEL